MACTTCGKTFSILRREHGCPSCGFSFCSNCLKHKVFVSKINAKAKVCSRCSLKTPDEREEVVPPPDALIKRIQALKDSKAKIETKQEDKYERLKKGLAPEDEQIVDRLRQLKDRPQTVANESVEDQIAERLKKLRGEDNLPKCTEEEMRERLARLKGETSKSTTNNLPPADLRSDQEKTEDLIRQYLEETKIDTSNKEAFDERIKEIESRLHSLSGTKPETNKPSDSESESEDDILRRIIEKAQAEAALDNKITESELSQTKVEEDTSELPWCEICNEDAVMRCLGCRYLFCKTCFNEHKDDDDGCNRYEPYRKPANIPA